MLLQIYKLYSNPKHRIKIYLSVKRNLNIEFILCIFAPLIDEIRFILYDKQKIAPN